MAERDFMIRIKAETNDAQRALDNLRKSLADAFGEGSKEAATFSKEGQAIVDTLNQVKTATRSIDVYKTVGEDFKKVSKEVRENKAALKEYSASIRQTKEELEKAAEAERALAASKLIDHYVKIRDEQQKLNVTLTETKKKLVDAETAVNKYTAELAGAKKVIHDIKTANDALGKIDIFRNLATEARQAGQALKASQENLNKYSAEMKQAQNAVASLETELARLESVGDKAGMKQAREDLAKLREELTQAKSDYRGAQKETIALSSSYEKLRAKTKDASAGLKEMGVSTANLSAEKKRLQGVAGQEVADIGRLTTSLQKAQGEYVETAQSTNALIVQNDRMTISLNNASAALTDIGIDSNKAEEAQAELAQKIGATDKSIRDLEKELKSLQSGYKTSQADAKRLADTQEALRQSVKKAKGDMSALGVDTKNLSSEQKRLEAETRKAALAFNDFKNRAAGMSALGDSMKKVSIATREAGIETKKSFQQMQSGASSFGSSLGGLKSQIAAAFSVYAVYNFGKALVDASIQIDGLRMAFKAIYGTMEEAGNQLSWLRETTRKYGLELYSTADSYKQFAASSMAAGMSIKETQESFQGVTTAIAALRMPTESANRVFYALSQMMAKGKVSAEELRQQMGESLPGAIAYAAKAMGMTTAEFDKAMASGKIMSDEFIPKFAAVLRDQFGGAATEAADTLQGSVNRMITAWTDFKVALSDGEFADSMKEVFSEIERLLSSSEFQESMKLLVDSFVVIGSKISDATVLLVDFIAKTKLLDAVKDAADTIAFFFEGALVIGRGLSLIYEKAAGSFLELTGRVNTFAVAAERMRLEAQGWDFALAANIVQLAKAKHALKDSTSEQIKSIQTYGELQEAIKQGIVLLDKQTGKYIDNSAVFEQRNVLMLRSLETERQITDEITRHLQDTHGASIDSIIVKYDELEKAIWNSSESAALGAEENLKKALDLAEAEKQEKIKYYNDMLKAMSDLDMEHTESYKRITETRDEIARSSSARREGIEKSYIASLTAGQKNASDNLRAIQSRIDELVQKRANLMSADEKAAKALSEALSGLSAADARYYQSAIKTLDVTEKSESSYRQFSGANETLAQMREKLAEGTDMMSEAELKVATNIVESVAAIGENIHVEGQRQKVLDGSKVLLDQLYGAQQKIEEAKLDKAKSEVDSFKERLESAKQVMVDMASQAEKDMELKLETEKAKSKLDEVRIQHGELSRDIQENPIEVSLGIDEFLIKIDTMRKEYNELKQLIEEKNEIITEFTGKASPEKPLSETIQDVSTMLVEYQEKANQTNTSTVDFGDTRESAEAAAGAMVRFSESSDSASSSAGSAKDNISGITSGMSDLNGVTMSSSTSLASNTKAQKDNADGKKENITLLSSSAEGFENLKLGIDEATESVERHGKAMGAMAAVTSKYIQSIPQMLESIKQMDDAMVKLGYSGRGTGADDPDKPQVGTYKSAFGGMDWDGYGKAMEAYHAKRVEALKALMEQESELTAAQEGAHEKYMEAVQAKIEASEDITSKIQGEKAAYQEVQQAIEAKTRAVVTGYEAKKQAADAEIGGLYKQIDELQAQKDAIARGEGYTGPDVSNGTAEEQIAASQQFHVWKMKALQEIEVKEEQIRIKQAEGAASLQEKEQQRNAELNALNEQQITAQVKMQQNVATLQESIQPFNDALINAGQHLNDIIDQLNELKSSNEWAVKLKVFLEGKGDFLTKLKSGKGVTFDEFIQSLAVDHMATGGQIFKRYPSGRLPGPDRKEDTVPVLARQGEWFIHNEAVEEWRRKLGGRFMHAINAPWSSLGRSLLQRVRGYATGGEVALSAASAGSGGNAGWQPARTVEINFKANNGQAVSGYFAESDTDRLINILKTAQMRAV